MQYYIAQNGAHFTMAKFGDKKAPFEVYDIVGEHCNCPSPKSPCKHVIMLREWLKLDTPSLFYWDDDENEFVKHLFAADLPIWVKEMLLQMEETKDG